MTYKVANFCLIIRQDPDVYVDFKIKYRCTKSWSFGEIKEYPVSKLQYAKMLGIPYPMYRTLVCILRIMPIHHSGPALHQHKISKKLCIWRFDGRLHVVGGVRVVEGPGGQVLAKKQSMGILYSYLY